MAFRLTLSMATDHQHVADRCLHGEPPSMSRVHVAPGRLDRQMPAWQRDCSLARVEGLLQDGTGHRQQVHRQPAAGVDVTWQAVARTVAGSGPSALGGPPAGCQARPVTAEPGSRGPTHEATASGDQVEVLDEPTCWALLRTQHVGRLALAGHPPAIFPVNYLVHEGEIRVRTDPGAKLDRLRQDAQVAFEVDEIDPVGARGWSVVVTGRAIEEVHLPATEPRPAPRPWGPGAKAYWLRITPDAVSGRRIRHLDAPATSGYL